VTKIIKNNTIFKLQPQCNAFIGTTRVHSKGIIETNSNVTYNHHPMLIAYECCKKFQNKSYMPDLKPLKISKLNTDDLNMAQYKLNQYSDELDRLIQQPFINKHIHWFTITTIVFVVLLIVLYIYCKCRRRRSFKIGIVSNSDSPPSPPRDQNRTPLLENFRSFLPKRRPSVRVGEPIEEEFELNSNKSLV